MLPNDKHEFTLPSLQEEVKYDLAERAETDGRKMAFDFSQILVIEGTVDDLVQRIYPALAPLLPAQVQTAAAIVAQVLHAIHTGTKAA